MPKTDTLHGAFIEELRDVYNAEKQLTRALPKLAKAASSTQLRTAFEEHLEETKGHVERLEQVFKSLDQKARGKHCKGIAGIIEEGKSVLEEDFEESTKDALLIAGGQRAEHYEIAAYGTLAAWTRVMGHSDAADLLEQTLQEEKAADQKLNQIAEGGVNRDAAEKAHGSEEEESGRRSAPRSSQKKKASRSAARRTSTRSKTKT